MGRKTFESVGSKPLPGRPHVIVSRNAVIEMPGVETATSVKEGLEQARVLARETGADALCVVGGGEIYRQTIADADELHVTHVETDLEGDTYFPAIEPDLFELVEETAVPAGKRTITRRATR